VALSLLCASASRSSEAPTKCDAPELFGNEHYNELVCQGIALIAAGKAADGIRAFESALAISLFEYPNFRETTSAPA
jgi:hypothetical protein